jgi:hypothetical protein
MSKHVANEEVLERTGEKRALLNHIPRRIDNRTGYILKRTYLLHDVVEGQMTEMKGVG